MRLISPFFVVLAGAAAFHVVAFSAARAGSEARPAKDDADLRAWLENMAWHHGYSAAEMRAVLGLSEEELNAALARFDIRRGHAPPRAAGDPLLVLPYPGGRHPRIGFLEGAIDPQRETKLSVFAPWQAAMWCSMCRRRCGRISG